ncbi:MAG TPA: hypothetical protein VF277_03905, partial [Steroidobacteraceae bacterium]
MASRRWYAQAGTIPGAPAVRGLTVTRDAWRQAVRDLAAGAARLLSMWAGPDGAGRTVINAAFIAEPGVLVLALPWPDAGTSFPGIEDNFPAAGRLQRALRDVSGIASTAADTRPWLRHASWPAGFVPLDLQHVQPRTVPVPDNYEFIRVQGDGVHEVPVGPVHAGTIEPGHFRFSIVGEKVLRLEQRLGYAHKGIERRFTELRQ